MGLQAAGDQHEAALREMLPGNLKLFQDYAGVFIVGLDLFKTLSKIII